MAVTLSDVKGTRRPPAPAARGRHHRQQTTTEEEEEGEEDKEEVERLSPVVEKKQRLFPASPAPFTLNAALSTTSPLFHTRLSLSETVVSHARTHR